MNRYKLLGLLLLILFVEVVSAQLPSHIPYRRGKLWGFSDSTKKILVKPVYKNISIIYLNTFIAEKSDTLFVLNKHAEPLFRVKKIPYSSRLGKSTRSKFFYIENLYNDSLVYGIINDTTFGVFNTLTAKCVITTQIAANYELSKFVQEEDFFIINWFIKGQRRISGVQEGSKSKTIVQVCDIERKKLIVEKTGTRVTITEDFFYRPNKKSVLLWADSLYCYFDDTLIASTKYSSIKSLGNGLFYAIKYGSQRTRSNPYGSIGQIVTQKDSVLNFDINSILLAIDNGQVNREGNYIIISNVAKTSTIAVFVTDSSYSFIKPVFNKIDWKTYNPKYEVVDLFNHKVHARQLNIIDTTTNDTIILGALDVKHLKDDLYYILTVTTKVNMDDYGKRHSVVKYHYQILNAANREIKEYFTNEGKQIDFSFYFDSLKNIFSYNNASEEVFSFDTIGQLKAKSPLFSFLGVKKEPAFKQTYPSNNSTFNTTQNAINAYKDSLTKLHHFTYLRERYITYSEPINVTQLNKELILVYSFNDTDFYLGYSVEAPFYHAKIDYLRGSNFSCDIIYYNNDTFCTIRVSNWLDENSTEDSVLYLKKYDFTGSSLVVFPQSKWLDERFPQGVCIKQGLGEGLISATGKILIKPKYFTLSYYDNNYNNINLADSLLATDFLMAGIYWSGYDIYRKSDCKLLIKNADVASDRNLFNPPNLLKVSKNQKEFYIDIYGTEYKAKGIRALFANIFQAILH